MNAGERRVKLAGSAFAEPEQPPRWSGPVHRMFGLSYAAYFCVPRLVLDAMPIEWQQQFVRLMNQLPETPTYACQRRDGAGRFRSDPLADYRHGQLPDEMRRHIDAAPLVTEATGTSL